MADLYTMEIAGIRFAVNTIHPLTLQNFHPPYDPFIFKADSRDARPTDMNICLQLGCPHTGKPEKIFDSHQSWSIFRDDDNYYISRYSPAFKNPLWLAKIDQGFTRVTLHCSEDLTEHRNGQTLISNPVSYPLDQILLMYILARKKGALIHAAGIGIGNKGLIFPGVSGAGKSTLSRQFTPGNDRVLLSDDRIAVREVADTFRAFGTPWPGDAGIAANRSAPLSAIFFIHHGSINSIKEISPKKALEKLLPVTSIPWYDREVMPLTLSVCEDMAFSVPGYELHFTPDAGVVNILEEYIR
jgi:hypothetical protein